MTVNLNALTTEELQKELARRNRPLPPPQPLSDIDWSLVEKLCNGYVASLEIKVDDSYVFDAMLKGVSGNRQNIFEAAIEAVYGPEVWKWAKKAKEVAQ